MLLKLKFLKIFFIIIILIIAVLAIYAIFFREVPETISKEYTVSTQDITGGININVTNRLVELIVNENSNEIKIQYGENQKEYYDFQINDNKVLEMKLTSNKELFDYIEINNSNVSPIKVELPVQFLGGLSITTSNNDIVIPEIDIQGNLELNANNGNIILNSVNISKDVNLTGKNGNITGTIKGSYDDFSINAKAHKGDSNLPANKEDGLKKLNVYTNNVDINLNFED